MNPPQISELPQKYQSLLDLAQERNNIHVHLLEQLKGGRTGALLYLVSVTQTEDSSLEHFVMKLDTVHKKASMDESSRHQLVASQSPENFSQQHIAQITYYARQNDCLVVFYSITGGSLLRFRTLAQYERQNQLEAIFRAASGCLLEDWNADVNFNHAVHPREVLDTWLGYRVRAIGRIAGFVENVLKLSPEVGGFLIDDQAYPNPLLYSRESSLWEGARPVDIITGNQHGDLNIGNILVQFDKKGTDLTGFYLIDFALYKQNMPLLFDQRYLEMSYLVRELERAPFEKWVDFVCRFAEEETPAPQTVPVELAGACAVINAGRTAYQEWLQSNHPSLVDDLWGQFWLAGSAAGLNFCNKGALSNTARLAGLIYAAAHLKRYCLQFGVSLPVDVKPLYGPGWSQHLILRKDQKIEPKPDIPAGEVTFLFSDIAGSTKLWEAFPDNMPAAIHRHDALIEQAAESNNGYVFKRVGDGYCMAFGSALEALNAAVVGQRALAAETWGRTGPLKVRMALYSGEADLSAGDYFGPVVNRAARLLEAVHGGQILISSSVRDQVSGALQEDLSCLDLGEHWLKDIPQPEHIFQVLAPGLPVEFPPPPTAVPKSHLLGMEAKSFIGRQDEIEHISKLLETNRLVTLCGPGGIGKTRLAQAAADANKGKFRQGAFFVPLLSVDTPTGIVPAVASEIGLTLLEGRTPQAQLVEYLQSRQMLLVLDNMEQLLVPEIAADTLNLIEAVLSAATELKLLVTSRELLRLSSEQPFIVNGLSIADHETDVQLVDECAVELFALRTREVQPTFELELGDNLHQVQDFCLMVEGMPLAIELAAAQMRLLPLADITSEIKVNLDVLDTGLRGGAARHSSIQAVFETSWGNLDEGTQEIFSKLSVFKGGFTLQAASEVAGASIQKLTALMDKSFVSRDAHGRFALHALLQMFAAQKLAEIPDENNRAQGLHFGYYSLLLAEAVEQWRESYQSDPFNRVSVETDNLRAAWKWILSNADWERVADYSENLWHFFKVLGRLPEIMEMLEDALRYGEEAKPPAEPFYLARWERHIGQAHLSLSELTLADEHFRSTLSYLGWSIPAAQIGLAAGLVKELSVQITHRAFPSIFIGRLEKDSESIQEAYTAYEHIVTRSAVESDTLVSSYCGLRSLNLAESGGLPPLMARAYASAGYMFGLVPARKLSDSYMKRAEELVLQTDSPESERWFFMLSGYYHFGIGEFSKAEEHTEKAIHLADELGKHWEMDNGNILLLEIALLRGQWVKSQEYINRIRQSASLRGDEGFEAAILYWEAIIKLTLGDDQEAIPLLEESASAPDEVMMIFDWLIVHGYYGLACCRQGQLDRAVEEARQADRLLATISRPSGAAYIFGYTASVRLFLELMGRETISPIQPEVQEMAKRGCVKLNGLASSFPVAKPLAFLYQGIYYNLSGDLTEALKSWSSSLAAARKLDLTYQQGLAHHQIGKHLSVGETTGEGWDREQHLQRAMEIFTDYEALYDLRLTQDALGKIR